MAPEVFVQASMQFNIRKEIEASMEITGAWIQCVDAVFYKQLIYYLDRNASSKNKQTTTTTKTTTRTKTSR